ncbi:hypothetical protein VKT23_015715 [Stygiomarasmius scandens]|uniref:Uncharacterized protein n=1 Tax=Marasmiellus scandens TaxID=2682957 RepID=A0ABR1IZX4_9AGAR
MRRYSDWFLSPRPVIFFNQHWRRITNKHELRDKILSTILLGEQSIRDADVLTRMSWASGKLAARAHCLSGVSVEPDYDEFCSTSFNRPGKALFDAQPKLRERLYGIGDDFFSDADHASFVLLLWSRFRGAFGMHSLGESGEHQDVEEVFTRADDEFIPGMSSQVDGDENAIEMEMFALEF